MSFQKEVIKLVREHKKHIICVQELPETKQKVVLLNDEEDSMFDFFFLLKKKEVDHIFYSAKTFISEFQTLEMYDALKYLERKCLFFDDYNFIYRVISMELTAYNNHINLYKDTEFVYRTFAFIEGETQYILTSEKIWYRDLLQSKKTEKEIVDHAIKLYQSLFE